VSTQSFTALATAAYCPRKLYYRRRDDDAGDPPDRVAAVRALARRYDELRAADDDALADEPLAVDPVTFRRNLGVARAGLDRFPELRDPAGTDVRLDGKDARGVAHKVLADPPAVSLVSAGAPPEQGVYGPQSVRLTAASLALANERERPVEVGYYEYPAHGVVRRVRLTARRKAAYRRALRAARELDGPPPRLTGDARCDACEYREECGVETRSLRSLLGL
jgi:CRISPR-associated exonuclease Cas4